MTATSASSQAEGAAGHPRLGIVAQVVAIIGIVACITLIAGVWLGRGLVADRVDALNGSADQAVAKASAAAGLVSGRIESVASDVKGIADAAQSISIEPGAAERLQALSGRVTGAIDTYRGVRSTYNDVREKAMSAINALETLDRFLPGVDVPQGPIDAFKTLDSKLTEIDDAVSSLASTVSSVGQAGVVANAISEKATAASNRLTAVSGAVSGVSERLVELQGNVRQMADRLMLYLLLATFGGTAALAYVALLNVALWSLGRHWRREARA